MKIEKIVSERRGWTNYYLKTDKVLVKLSQDEIGFYWGEIKENEDGELDIDEDEMFDISIPIGEFDNKANKFISTLDILEFIEFYQDKKYFFDELKKIRTKYRDVYVQHRKLVSSELVRIAKSKDEKELNNFLLKIEKILENHQKKERIKDKVIDNFKPFGFASYWQSDFDGKRVIVIRISEDKYIVIVCSNETAEIRKTKNLAILYDIICNRNLKKMARLSQIKEEDIDEDIILLIKALIFDLEENVKNKIINLITLSSI